ncbi:MAG: sterol desaturase [Flavobacteriaceae bacterium]|nr:sterol desaturase [Flavobacteriaceae bacterium]|tara:strand:+ start:9635 stop:10897 length:1263 start_codon:yes stop_codon:yes gene_type:complete
MEAYANALLIAVPLFMFLITIEIIYGHYVGKQTHTFMDTISSLTSGITNVIKDSLGLIIILVSYPYLVEKISIISLPNNFFLWFIAFICIDFAQYWIHRLNHKINFFWNQHIIHHSSEEFNLACALRQSISNLLGFTAVFLIPAAILGVPPKIITTLAPLHLFGQFWYHTKHIGKLGFLEYIIVTPSQHRVHHAINPEYIDKNLASIFCVWDRLFGTFQEELDDVEPVYGVLKPVRTWNPFWINFQHLWRLITDAFYTRDWKAKFLIWFKPTGWRPDDMKKRFPIPTINDVKSQVKYSVNTTLEVKIWAFIQLLAVNIFLFFLLYNYSELDINHRFWIASIIMITIFGYTSIMDGHKWANRFEFVRCSLALIYFNLPFQFEFYSFVSKPFLYFSIFYFSLTLLSLLFIRMPVKIVYGETD